MTWTKFKIWPNVTKSFKKDITLQKHTKNNAF